MNRSFITKRERIVRLRIAAGGGSGGGGEHSIPILKTCNASGEWELVAAAKKEPLFFTGYTTYLTYILFLCAGVMR